MAIIVFEQHPGETASELGAALQNRGHRLEVVRNYASQALPGPGDFAGVDGLVVMGGPQNVDQADQHAWMKPMIELLAAAHAQKVPIVGVCLGAQLLAEALGGKVEAMERPEIGMYPVKLAFAGTTDPILAGTPWDSPQFHCHGYQVTQLPDGGVPLAGSAACKHQAFRVGMTTYALQYHFEWTRDDLHTVLDQDRDWIEQSGLQAKQIRIGIDEHYYLYRHLGDRLCRNIADLLFPLDKRLSHTKGPAENYHASNF